MAETQTSAPSAGNSQQNSGGEQLSDTEISALFRHDPLSTEPVNPERMDAAEPTGQVTTPVVTPTPTPTPVTPGGTPVQTQGQPAEPAVDPAQRIAILEARLAALTSGGEDGQGQPQPPAPQGQPQPTQATEQDPLGLGALPPYMYQVPPQVVAALAHEDPNIRGQALAAWTAASLQQVHHGVRQELTKVIAKMREEVPLVIQTMLQYQNATQSIFQDFYGTYKEFDKPEFRQVILSVAQAVKAERPDLAQGGWNARFRDEVANRAAKVLNLQLAPRQQGGQPQKLSSTTSRPGTQQLNGQAKHIGDMFD